MNLSFSLNTHRVYRIAVSVFFFIAGFTFSTWASRIPDIKNKLHLSEAALGTVLLALPVGLMASLPIAGWLVSRFLGELEISGPCGALRGYKRKKRI
jgi:MFS family permease